MAWRDYSRKNLLNLRGPEDLCADCSLRHRCRSKGTCARDSLFAWAHDKVHICIDRKIESYRGLEGVRP